MNVELGKLYSMDERERATFVAWEMGNDVVRAYVWSHDWVSIRDVSRSFWEEFCGLMKTHKKQDFWRVWMVVDVNQHGQLTSATFRMSQMGMLNLADPLAAAQAQLGDDQPDEIVREILGLIKSPTQSRTAHNQTVSDIINQRKAGRGA